MNTVPIHIAHIADLHIGNGDPAVYRQMFRAFAHSLGDDVGIVIIAGDIFHHKTRYSGDDVELFMELLRMLTPRQVIVIPGNHDTNLNDVESLDLLYPLRDKFTYWKESGSFTIGLPLINGEDNRDSRGVIIKFRHISVFSTDVTSAEVMSQLQSDEILLYHGMVCGAKFGKHTAHDRVITREIMDRAWITMLGDIHEHQFVSATAAYPGSLVQQNTGESIIKGYILWDYAARIGRFVEVKGESNYVRLDLRGKSQTEIANVIAAQSVPGSIIKLSVLADDSTSESDLEAVREKFGRIDMVKVKHGCAEFITKDTVLETLREMLVQKGMSAGDVEECVTDYASNVTTQTRRKWHVTAMKWDNMFKYGPGNLIDFTTLEGGISGVIAANRAGKSSIIDVLVFGLFGKLLRGNKETMINRGCAKSSVRVDFVSGVQKFYISREDDRVKNTKIELYEDTKWNNQGNDRNHVPNWVNRTLESTTKTHEWMHEFVGTYKQFLSTGLYYNAREDIVALGATDCMKILADLFGLNDNEKIIKELKDKEREYRTFIKALKQPVNKDDSNIILLENDLAINDIALNARVENLKLLIASQNEIESLCSNQRSVSAVDKEIKELSADIKVACKTARITSQHATAPRVYCTHDDRELSVMICRDIKEICAEIAVAKSMLDARFTGIVECVDVGSDINAPADRDYSENLASAAVIAGVEKRLLSLRPITINEHAITDLRASILSTDALITDIVTNYDVITDLNRAKLTDIEVKLESIRNVDRDITACEVSIAKCDVDNAVRAALSTEMTFGDCDCCRKNAYVLQQRSDKNALMTDLRSAQVSKNAMRECTLQRDQTRAQLATAEQKHGQEISILKSKMTWQQEQLCIAEHARDDAIMQNEKNAIERDIITREFNVATAKASVEHRKKVLQDHEMNQSRIRHNEGFVRLSSLEPEYVATTKVVLAKRKCIAADNYFSYITHRASTLQKELIRSQKEEHRRDMIKQLTVEINDERSAIHAIDIISAQLKMSLDLDNADALVRKIYNELYPKYAAKLSMYKKYIECLGTQGLRAEVVRKYVERVVVQTNTILSAVTDFTVMCKVEKNSIEFYMSEGSQEIHAEMASGFQQFIMSIAFRLSLIDVLAASPDFIIIDEGFGCMDKSNLKNLTDFMCNDTLNSYKFVFVVSHIDEISNMITNPMYIRAKNNKSWITHGDITANTISLETFSGPSTVPIIVPVIAHGQFRCDCGVIIKKTSKALHIKSKKHADALAML